MRKQTLPLWVLSNEALDGATDLETQLVSKTARMKIAMDPHSYHGVLSHENNTLATETQTNLVHLLGADIVDGDNEDGLVLFEKTLQLIEVSGLGVCFAPHVSFFVKIGCLRAKLIVKKKN